MGREFELWSTILDLIGPRNEWPRYMPGLFWKTGGTLSYQERLTVATFSFVNALPCHLLVEWCQLKGILSSSGVEGVKNLYNIFENTNRYDHFYQWNVAMGRDITVGGDTHFY